MEKGGERIGVIGATTPDLVFISSPRNVGIIADVAAEVQAEVDRLEAAGVNKIVLLSHLQDVDADVALLGRITGVDVVVAGGGDELLAGECDLLIPGDGPPTRPYPMIATDRNGARVPVVTTPGQYSYLGKLVVTFDHNGILEAIDDNASGPIRIATGDSPTSIRPDCQVQREVVQPLIIVLDDLGDPIAQSQVALEGRRSEVRFRETNLGNLMADALHWQVTLKAPEWGASTPDVAIQNGGGIRLDLVLPSGQIRELDTFDMAPFVNLVTVVENVSRSQFKEILENAVSRAVDGGAFDKSVLN